ncbi:MAG: response regulator [Paracoccaceae bacterium]
MTDADTQPALMRPTPTRPLLGLTVLVVEDSRYACDAMRLLCLRSGARIRRADCLTSARRHLRVYCPTIIVIDMGLPDGNGAELISELSQGATRVPVVLGTSGDDYAQDIAIAAGADGFLPKPLESLSAFQSAILQALPPDMRPEGLRVVRDEPVRPDPVAFHDDMAHAHDLLNGSDPVLDYIAQFLTGVAHSAGDDSLALAARDLAQARTSGAAWGGPLVTLRGMVQSRLASDMAI